MEADVLRAEAEWQAQEIVAHARRQAASDGRPTPRLSEVEKAEAGCSTAGRRGPVLADALARPAPTGSRDRRRLGRASLRAAAPADDPRHPRPRSTSSSSRPPPPAPDDRDRRRRYRTSADGDIGDDTEIVPPSTATPASASQRRRRALRVGTPVRVPTWWTRDGAQG